MKININISTISIVGSEIEVAATATLEDKSYPCVVYVPRTIVYKNFAESAKRALEGAVSDSFTQGASLQVKISTPFSAAEIKAALKMV